MSSIEHRLESWAPRRPSRALEHRIFGDTAGPARSSEWAGYGPATGWLVPLTACAFALCLSLTPSGPRFAPMFANVAGLMVVPGRSNVTQLRTGPVLPNPTAAPVHSAANCLQVASFTWTNLLHAHSTNASFSGDNPPF